jgi:VCBS repeat-containing protein
MKEISYGVLEVLLTKLQKTTPDFLDVEELPQLEIEDCDTIKKHTKHATAMGGVYFELESKTTYHYYADEEETAMTLTLSKGGQEYKVETNQPHDDKYHLLKELQTSLEAKAEGKKVESLDALCEELKDLAFG